MTPHADGPPRRARARFTPGVVVIAVAACLPPTLLAGPGGRPDVVIVVAALGLALVGSLGERLRPGLSALAREVFGTAVLTVAAVLLLALVARSQLPPHDFLGHLAALLVSTAVTRRTVVRTTLQVAFGVAVAVLLVADVGAGPEAWFGAAVPLGLLMGITLLANTLAGDLERARRRTAAGARRSATRAELLDTVREVARAGAVDAVDALEATVGGLRELGFDVAAVALLDGGDLVPHRVEGLRWTAPLSADHPQLRRVLGADRPLVFDEYRTSPDRIPGVDLGTVLLTPIRADGVPLGVLVAGRRTAGPADGADVEVIDVLAAHLGAAIAVDRNERRQQALLARLWGLDQLRSGFVDRVSADLRDPLTVVRGIAQTLTTHADRLAPGQRAELCGRLVAQASALESTLEALLDFSRQPALADGELTRIDLFELLGPPLRGSGLAVDGEVTADVVVDVVLLRRAIEVLRRAELSSTAQLEVRDRDTEVTVHLHLAHLDGLEGSFARAVSEQLVVAGGGRSERTASGLALHLPKAPVATMPGGAR